MGKFDGKVAIVTGGTRGLGRATALRLARDGATLALNYRRDEQSARHTLEEIRTFAPRSMLAQADLGEDEQVRAMVRRVGEAFGRVDILIANGGAALDHTRQSRPPSIAIASPVTKPDAGEAR